MGQAPATLVQLRHMHRYTYHSCTHTKKKETELLNTMLCARHSSNSCTHKGLTTPRGECCSALPFTNEETEAQRVRKSSGFTQA